MKEEVYSLTHNIDVPSSRVAYMLQRCLGSDVSKRHLAAMHRSLENGFGSGNLGRVLAGEKIGTIVN